MLIALQGLYMVAELQRGQRLSSVSNGTDELPAERCGKQEFMNAQDLDLTPYFRLNTAFPTPRQLGPPTTASPRVCALT